MAMRLPEQLRQSLAAYIDAHYVGFEKFAVPAAAKRTVCVAAPRREEVCDACAPQAEMPCPTMAAPGRPARASSLQEMLKQADAGFSETLLNKIDVTGKKDSEIYKRAGLTKQHFSKIRNNPDYRPTKPTAIALALALELDLDQTKDLIGRAGYALTNSSKFDLIVRYFIENRIFDVTEINIALYEFDQPLLGA